MADEVHHVVVAVADLGHRLEHAGGAPRQRRRRIGLHHAHFAVDAAAAHVRGEVVPHVREIGKVPQVGEPEEAGDQEHVVSGCHRARQPKEYPLARDPLRDPASACLATDSTLLNM